MESPLKFFAALWGQIGLHLTLPVTPDARKERRGTGPGVSGGRHGARKGSRGFMLNSPVLGVQLHRRNVPSLRPSPLKLEGDRVTGSQENPWPSLSSTKWGT